MTTFTLPAAPESVPSVPTLSRPPSLFHAWTSSFLIYFYPAKTSRLWLAISPVNAAVIALLNLALALLWLLLLATFVYAWNTSILHVEHRFKENFIPAPVQEFLRLFQTLPSEFFTAFSHFNLAEKISLSMGVLFLLAAVFAITCFLLLPFAARPGANKPCVKHVLRTVLLATGLVHLWAPVLVAAFLLFIVYRFEPAFDIILGPLTLTLTTLFLWTFAALLTAVTRDYRSPAEFPQPQDPTCDNCGYNLIAAEPDGRCPECGKPVVESLGPDIRPPTLWESKPSLFNLPAIKNQLASLIKHPRKLFLAMPTLTGHPAAHRWLLLSLVVIAAAASLISPAIFLLLFREVGWSLNILWGGMLIGIAWSLLGLMMVGIETAGIATFSRMKGHPVYLAAAAKVTAYSSPLMLFWVLLGALQLLLTLYAWDHRLVKSYSMRADQVLLALSLSFAHIGGLLWYELTVYRGIRSIRFANR